MGPLPEKDEIAVVGYLLARAKAAEDIETLASCVRLLPDAALLEKSIGDVDAILQRLLTRSREVAEAPATTPDQCMFYASLIPFGSSLLEEVRDVFNQRALAEMRHWEQPRATPRGVVGAC